MEPRRNGQPECDALSGTDIPTGSDAFKLVMHQLHIHDTWRDAVEKTVQKDVGAKEMESEKLKCKKEDNIGDKNGDARPRTDSFSKLKRFLNINPKPPYSPNSDKRTRGHISPGKMSPRSPVQTSLTPLSPVQRRAHLEVGEDAFRVRAHSDSSAINPRKKKAGLAVAELTSPLDNLHVHWPDLEQGIKLTTTLRPRSYSHGSGERPAKPILKKSSSRTVYY